MSWILFRGGILAARNLPEPLWLAARTALPFPFVLNFLVPGTVPTPPLTWPLLLSLSPGCSRGIALRFLCSRRALPFIMAGKSMLLAPAWTIGWQWERACWSQAAQSLPIPPPASCYRRLADRSFSSTTTGRATPAGGWRWPTSSGIWSCSFPGRTLAWKTPWRIQ